MAEMSRVKTRKPTQLFCTILIVGEEGFAGEVGGVRNTSEQALPLLWGALEVSIVVKRLKNEWLEE